MWMYQTGLELERAKGATQIVEKAYWMCTAFDFSGSGCHGEQNVRSR